MPKWGQQVCCSHSDYFHVWPETEWSTCSNGRGRRAASAMCVEGVDARS